MKKLFTIDDIMVAFIPALGYGFGYLIPKRLGWPEIACIAACMAVGIALEEIVGRIAFSEAIQKKPLHRVLIYTAFFIIFLVAHTVSVVYMDTSMLGYLGDQLAYVIGFPILGFIVNLIIRGYRAWKIRKRYGDGRDGYVFDLEQEDIEEANQRNRPVLSVYDADCAVRTRTGVFVGEKDKKTIRYLGIPYAKPPVGKLRWKAPEPLPPSEAVFEAKNFGASAIQVEHKGSIIKHHRQSEDCLTLNIIVSSRKTEGKKPVIVLFHHGDFTFGGSVDPLLYGDNFVSKHPDVVFVSFNHRLGIFGFIDFSEVPGGEARPDALNLGLLDQAAALRWIRENISAFGGDPDRITALGFESGASSILLLAASGQAKGLFQRAFVFNGSPESAYDTPEASRALAKRLLAETHTGTMEDLLQLSTEALKDAAQRLWRNMCAPTCDGTWIPADVYRAFEAGAASGIEFIIGIPSHEMRVFRSFVGDRNYMDGVFAAVADMKKTVGGTAADAARAYVEAQASAGLEAQSELVEQWNALCVYRVAEKLAEGGNPVHLMYWDEKPLIENLGSGTVDAAAALLGNAEALQMYGNVLDADLSETLQSLLLKFVSGKALRLYTNEIKGVDAFDWEAFPGALVVSDGELLCGTELTERLKEEQA